MSVYFGCGRIIGALLIYGCLCFASAAQEATKEAPPKYAGPTDKGYLLPNGWTITPVGEQIKLHDLPLNIIPLADNNTVLVSTNGFNKHQLALIDLTEKSIIDSESTRDSWFGLALTDSAVWWAGGGAGRLLPFSFDGKTLEPQTVWSEPLEPNSTGKKLTSFKSGLAVSGDQKTLYSLDIEMGTISAIDLAAKKVSMKNKIAQRPYDVVMGQGGFRLFVSDWADRCVHMVSPRDLRSVQKIPVGEHPNQIAVHPKDDRIFVACASSNSVSVIDTKRGIVTETIVTSLFPNAPEGSTPDALCVSPDGKTLYVANADNNCVAVIDISTANKSQVKGFIPTGWYPTAVAITPDGKNLLVGVGKGNQSAANGISPKPPAEGGKPGKPSFRYIGTVLSGALSIVAVPDEKKLAEYTEIVYRNCPYSDKLLSEAPSTRKTAIPTKVGEKSPIEHVIYIIKENRTYDQLFSDIPKGNRDPSLLMFGEEVTPNQHKLVQEFVLLDNFYCNGQVSRDGHPWSTAAYNTDYVARDWMLTYSARAGIDDDDDGDLSRPPSGYLWDLCGRHGLSYRSYGEFGRRVSQSDGSVAMEAAVPGLIGHMCPQYGIGKKKGDSVRDTDNVEVFLKEFEEYEKNNSLPKFIIMSLGEDHTRGTTPGAFTPRACVASNDLALGQLVDKVSKSKYWPKIAIFVIQDDAQNGPDHVDAHRTVALAISPYIRRGHLDSTMYSTVSMIRTMELILGLPPLSQYDAGARPMFESFTDSADLKPYDHVPAKIDLNAKNSANVFGAARSAKMDFSEYDRIDDFELNEILWKSIKGEDAPMPPAVRRAIAYRRSNRE